jgi:nucleoside-diphosphate-sugar epimerase
MSEQVNSVKSDLSVGIIGCGWLGKVLAANLLEKNISVLATSSQLVNVEQLIQQGINAQQLMLPADNKTQLAKHDVFSQQSLVIAITPKFKQGRIDYADKITQLVKAAQQRGLVQRIILLSSTAIYNGLEGTVGEESSLNMAAEKVQTLNAAEQVVLRFSRQGAEQGVKQGKVIRLAGLVGPDRHPGKFILANKTLSNSTAPVNLIHQQDAVGLIESLLQVNSPRGIFNGVSDTHVSKKEYYQCAAESLKLNPPAFAQKNINETTRVVSGEKAKKALNYPFAYSDLLAWL